MSLFGFLNQNHKEFKGEKPITLISARRGEGITPESIYTNPYPLLVMHCPHCRKNIVCSGQRLTSVGRVGARHSVNGLDSLIDFVWTEHWKSCPNNSNGSPFSDETIVFKGLINVDPQTVDQNALEEAIANL